MVLAETQPATSLVLRGLAGCLNTSFVPLLWRTSRWPWTTGPDLQRPSGPTNATAVFAAALLPHLVTDLIYFFFTFCNDVFCIFGRGCTVRSKLRVKYKMSDYLLLPPAITSFVLLQIWLRCLCLILADVFSEYIWKWKIIPFEEETQRWI